MLTLRLLKPVLKTKVPNSAGFYSIVEGLKLCSFSMPILSQGLGKMGIPCYNEDFVFLIKYVSAKRYSLN